MIVSHRDPSSFNNMSSYRAKPPFMKCAYCDELVENVKTPRSVHWLRKLALASCPPDGNLLYVGLVPVIHFRSSPPHTHPEAHCRRRRRRQRRWRRRRSRARWRSPRDSASGRGGHPRGVGRRDLFSRNSLLHPRVWFFEVIFPQSSVSIGILTWCLRFGFEDPQSPHAAYPLPVQTHTHSKTKLKCRTNSFGVIVFSGKYHFFSKHEKQNTCVFQCFSVRKKTLITYKNY